PFLAVTERHGRFGHRSTRIGNGHEWTRTNTDQPVMYITIWLLIMPVHALPENHLSADSSTASRGLRTAAHIVSESACSALSAAKRSRAADRGHKFAQSSETSGGHGVSEFRA